MLRRTRRPVALLAPVLLVFALAAGCGGTDDSSDKPRNGLDAVSISGDVGSAPMVAWKSMMTAGKPDVQTLVEGDGAALKKGDQVLVNYWLGDGYTEKAPVDTFGADEAGFLLTVGKPTVPQTQTPTAADIATLFVSSQITAGVTRGTRLTITADSSRMFGQYVSLPGVAQANIGNNDGLLVVADVLDTPVLDGPDGEQQRPDPKMPQLTFAKGDPSGFDFAGVATPDAKLHTTVLKKGTGPEVAKGDILVADYLGQVYDTPKPFDESYSKTPLATPIGLLKVVKGWDQGLVGQTVGSRVVLQIPPDLGYGKTGSGETIPPHSTLYFVIDILGAA